MNYYLILEEILFVIIGVCECTAATLKGALVNGFE